MNLKNITDLKLSRYQRWINPHVVDLLANELSKKGYNPAYPIVINQDGEISDGGHRYAACLKAEVQEVPVVFIPDEEDPITFGIRCNLDKEHGREQDVFDYAELCYALKADGLSLKEIAERLGNGWGIELVSRHKALKEKVSEEAWNICRLTTNGEVVKDDENTLVKPSLTIVKWSEGLLRTILDLTPDQQLELVSDLAEGRIEKGKFKKTAERYRQINDMIKQLLALIAHLPEEYQEKGRGEIARGATDIQRIADQLQAEYDQKTGVQIICGDFNAEVLNIPDDSVDLVLTDPPYGISQESKVTKQGSVIVAADFDQEDTWDTVDPLQFLDTLSTWCQQWARVVRPGGAVVVFCDKALVSHLWDTLKEHGLSPKNTIVWAKSNPHPAALARRNLISATEFMVWAVKPGAPYTFNESDAWNRQNIITTGLCAGRERMTDPKGGTLHPTQKPEALLAPLVEVFSSYGDTVLDGFMGVGSTGAVARRAGRRFIGIEQNTTFVEAAQRRLA